MHQMQKIAAAAAALSYHHFQIYDKEIKHGMINRDEKAINHQIGTADATAYCCCNATRQKTQL